jgi:hypothetical protein
MRREEIVSRPAPMGLLTRHSTGPADPVGIKWNADCRPPGQLGRSATKPEAGTWTPFSMRPRFGALSRSLASSLRCYSVESHHMNSGSPQSRNRSSQGVKTHDDARRRGPLRIDPVTQSSKRPVLVAEDIDQWRRAFSAVHESDGGWRAIILVASYGGACSLLARSARRIFPRMIWLISRHYSLGKPRLTYGALSIISANTMHTNSPNMVGLSSASFLRCCTQDSWRRACVGCQLVRTPCSG